MKYRKLIIGMAFIAMCCGCSKREPDYSGLLFSRLGEDVSKTNKAVYVNGDFVSIISCQTEPLGTNVENILRGEGWQIDVASTAMIEASKETSSGTQTAKLRIEPFGSGRALWVYAEGGAELPDWFQGLLVRAKEYEHACRTGELPVPVWE